MNNVRLAATHVIQQLLVQKRSLATLLPTASQQVEAKDKGLLQELCFGTARWQPQLQLYLNELLEKPLKQKDADIQALLLIGAYQLLYTRIPDHAALGETVEVCRLLKKTWATKFVNGVLRQLQRRQTELQGALEEKSPVFRTAHPNWLINAITTAWPDQAEHILANNNLHPPFTLRVNTQRIALSDYLKQLEQAGIDATASPYSEFGVTLSQPINVEHIPGFMDGWVSVQDEAAQFAAPLLQLQPGQRVLDACCAPGGKTGHILELETELAEVVALDLEARRLERVQENLQRLNKTATLCCGDASDLDSWWDGKLFDRILLDAPCSATGVIRRHPDIKLLRTRADIVKLAEVQAHLLNSLWPLLKPDGLLVYATCSILPEENSQIIQQFLATTPVASEVVIDKDWGIAQTSGRQLFPQPNGHDGFYYACLKKQTT